MVERFNHTIVIDGHGHGGRQFERAVAVELTHLMMFESGQLLLSELNRTGRRVTIRPWRGAAVNATATASDILGAEPAGSAHVGADYRLDPRFLGRGDGSASRVNYTPGQFQSIEGRWGEDPGGQGRHGDAGMIEAMWDDEHATTPMDRGDTIFHELVHSLREAMGLLHRTALGFGFENREELAAVFFTNVYCAERGIRLRADHDHTALVHPDYFMTNVTQRDQLRLILQEMPRFSDGLRQVRVEHNPLNANFWDAALVRDFDSRPAVEVQRYVAPPPCGRCVGSPHHHHRRRR